ncbi:MAG: hypothetical protein J1E64_09170 [Acetatifactor sp.]|nr:hypothetical protein [Acetatifactor sp.]
MGKKTTRAIIGLLISIILTACGKENTPVELGSTSVRLKNEAACFWQDSHVAMNNHYDGVTVKNGVVYGHYTKDGGTTVVSQNAQTGIILSEMQLPDVMDVKCITADLQGNIYFLGDETIWRISNGNVTHLEDIVLEDLDFAENITPKGIYIDGQGRFYLQYEMGLPANEFYEDAEPYMYSMADRIYVKDSQLNTLFYEQIPNSRDSRLLSFTFNENGIPTILAQSPEGIYVSEIDIEKQELVSKRQLGVIDFTEANKVTFTNNGFVFCRGNDLYQYDYTTQTQEKLLSLVSCGILADDVMYLDICDEKIEIIDNYNETAASEYVSIAKGENQKTTIMLGVMQSSNELEQIIAGYNRFSQEGKIEIVTYYTGGDFSRGLERLKLDIINGKAPDVIEVSVINASILSDKGVFADLYNFMETDAEFDREMLLEAVRRACESDGHLYSMGAAFQLHTMWGTNATFQGKSGISMSELLQILESNGRTINAIYGFSADEPVLTTLTTFAMDEFIDWDSAKCHFSSEYMKDLLEFAEKYNGGYEGSLRQGIADGEILLTVGQISSVADYQIQKELYGSDLSFVGYPTVDGTGTALSIRGGELAISAMGDHQDVAWDFVKYFIRNGHTGMGFPTLEEKFDALMQEAMRDDIVNSVDGTYREPKNVFTDGQGSYVEVFAASQADVDTIIHLIEGAESQYKYNPDIQKIINEEAESFFQGQKDVETVMQLIQNRVGLYLQEQMD